jgi:hypothetical protein
MFALRAQPRVIGASDAAQAAQPAGVRS